MPTNNNGFVDDDQDKAQFYFGHQNYGSMQIDNGAGHQSRINVYSSESKNNESSSTAQLISSSAYERNTLGNMSRRNYQFFWPSSACRTKRDTTNSYFDHQHIYPMERQPTYHTHLSPSVLNLTESTLSRSSSPPPPPPIPIPMLPVMSNPTPIIKKADFSSMDSEKGKLRQNLNSIPNPNQTQNPASSVSISLSTGDRVIMSDVVGSRKSMSGFSSFV